MPLIRPFRGVRTKSRPATLDTAALGNVVALGGTDAARRTLVDTLAASHVARGAGCIVFDASGDPAREVALRDFAKTHGRGDDLEVLDLAGRAHTRKPRATFDPFATGDADTLAKLVSRTTPPPWCQGAVHRGRAEHLLRAVAHALVHLRDRGAIRIDARTLSWALSLDRVSWLADPDRVPDLPYAVRRQLETYLRTLPGYVPEDDGVQPPETYWHHGFYEREFTTVLDAASMPHAMAARPDGPAVDMSEIVANRRILLVLLPHHDRSVREGCIAGRVALAALLHVMERAAHMHPALPWDDAVDRRVDTPVTCGVVLDDAGRYVVDGMDSICLRARPCGFAVAQVAGDPVGMRALADRGTCHAVDLADARLLMGTSDPDAAALSLSLATRQQRRRSFRDDTPVKALPRLGPGHLKALADGEAYVIGRDGAATLARISV